MSHFRPRKFLLILGGTLIFIGAAVVLLLATPPWHRREVVSERAAERAEDKIVLVRNRLARVPGLEAARLAGTTPGANAFEPIEVAFTEEEFNSILGKWSEILDWHSALDEYVTEAQISLQEGRVTLSGKLRSVPVVVSVHLRPWTDEGGKLHLRTEGIEAGRLPLPEALFGGQRERMVAGLEGRLPGWREKMEIRANGRSNFDAARVAGAKLLLGAMKEGAEARLILPVDHDKGVGVKITSLRIEGGEMKVGMVPLNEGERAALREQLKR